MTDGRHALVTVDGARYSAFGPYGSDSGTLTGACLRSGSSGSGGCTNGITQDGLLFGNGQARLTIATVKVGDSWTVSLLGTAAQTLSSAVASYSEDAILASFGLANMIKPSGTVALGGTAEVDLTGGVVALNLDLTDDTPVAKIAVRGTAAVEIDGAIYTVAGKEVGYGPEIILGKGRYRLVVYAHPGADSAKVPITVARS